MTSIKAKLATMSGRDSENRRKPRSVRSVMDSRSGDLGKLVSTARAIAGIEHHLAGLLDRGMAELVRVAAVRDSCLVLVTPSAALASRLRMDRQSIINSLNASANLRLESLSVKTAPIPRAPSRPRKRRQLSPGTREALARLKERS